jgi:putative oxidoreductase
MKKVLFHPWLARALEVILGGFFIYASLHKIADPPDFAKMVYNYRQVPNPFVNVFSILLPWLELVAGAALIVGWKCRRGAAALVGAMLVLFIAAIGWNLLRGHVTDCGCLHGSGPPKTREAKLLEMWVALGRDVAMLYALAHISMIRRLAGRKAPPAEVVEEVGAPAA